jgi:hypothetical protein
MRNFLMAGSTTFHTAGCKVYCDGAAVLLMLAVYIFGIAAELPGPAARDLRSAGPFQRRQPPSPSW